VRTKYCAEKGEYNKKSRFLIIVPLKFTPRNTAINDLGFIKKAMANVGLWISCTRIMIMLSNQ
ncbi:hypothetical protein AB4501_27115, partial [Vibrio sp. 10N.222.55.E8]